MNERSFIVKSLSAIFGSRSRDDSKQAASRLSFKIPDLTTILADDATSVGLDMAPALAR
jgi:hypothetical protein